MANVTKAQLDSLTASLGLGTLNPDQKVELAKVLVMQQQVVLQSRAVIAQEKAAAAAQVQAAAAERQAALARDAYVWNTARDPRKPVPIPVPAPPTPAP